ncbi:MAG TPA: hypothetical protein VK302_06365 [Terriglobales bacterium]|nr:hypothetical protein [Terriglobales bacterium]
MDRPNLECSILAVGEDLRVKLPQSMLQRTDWIAGEEPVNGWLLVGGPGRCRLLSAAEVDNDPSYQALLARIAAELSAPNANALEFHDEVSVALAVRLVPVRIAPPKPGWRLTLPGPIAAIMQIRPGESDIAALFIHDHIELWTIETLRSSVTPPLTEII